MRVSIGIWHPNPAQICFLDSCGVIYEKIERESDFCDFSHIFLFAKTSKNLFNENQTVIDFTQKVNKKFVSSFMLFDEQIDIFSFVGDLSSLTSIPMDLEKKTFVLRKGFHISQKKLPAEEIPLMDKGGLQRLFISALIKLFHSQNLALSLKSFSPVPEKTVFLFRVDTDFCDKKTIENYYENIKNLPEISWFVHCNVFEKTNDLFSAGKNDEFALHCFLHKVKPTKENLEKGIKILKEKGKEPLGFSAPYGVRNADADVFLKQNYNFEYSSDFSFAADALPFFVEETGLWQIPVFPLCVGSFNGVSSNENKIVEVFERYFARQFRYKIPFVLYDHPNHKKFDLLNKIFEKAGEYPILPMTFLEYCRFLEKRKNAKSDFPLITFEPNENAPQKFAAIKKISRFSPRLIKNTIINRTRRRKHDS
ncbi:MAG: hypothetical protein FWF51_09545 [Chitinivibrionia bacterium]|nr:hypothetical protein [Chitinivibrionia bacterium]